MKSKILSLCSLILDFGKVNRKSCHQDGTTFESDTDHTVMLGILACAIASKLYKNLDLGLIAQFALIHDLVEVHAGDTPTLVGISEEFFQDKEAREAEALLKIKEEFGTEFPWIHQTIEKYESLDTKEAKYIKTLDKVLPKITVVLNNAKFINDNNYVTKEEAKKSFDIQRIKLTNLIPDMPEILDIWEYFVEKELGLIKN